MELKKQQSNKVVLSDKQRTYAEIVEYLDTHWSEEYKASSLDRMKKLDQALGSPSQKVNVIMVNGTNGKSITSYLTTKLLMAEGLKVGTFCSPHILTYNERFTINNEVITNKLFTEVANEVINCIDSLSLTPYSHEVLSLIALKYFEQQGVEVAVVEINQGGTVNPMNICHAKVATITRVTQDKSSETASDLMDVIADMMGMVKKGTWMVSGDQNKSHLQRMKDLTSEQEGEWAMPMRKLASLPYPFEQIHGRCAALAERLSQMYVEKFLTKDMTITSGTLLSKPKGNRGRPTLEAKKYSELHPTKTLEQFWKEELNELPGRFQLLDKEKPSILLDTASNIDAIENLFLGIRLLHYQKPFKGLAIIAAASESTLHNEEFLKSVRYFFKKTSGQLFVCPIEDQLPGALESSSWNAEKVANDVKSLKVKARACKNFEEAFELAKKSVDERNGLIVVTGSSAAINAYWTNKGIKKF